MNHGKCKEVVEIISLPSRVHEPDQAVKYEWTEEKICEFRTWWDTMLSSEPSFRITFPSREKRRG
jgi:hypothetical protein